MRVENGLTELGPILGGVQMNARIKAHLIIIVSGRSESYNKKCTKMATKMHQKCTEKCTKNESLRHPRRPFIIQGTFIIQGSAAAAASSTAAAAAAQQQRLAAAAPSI